MAALASRTGFEVELLAPPGSDRHVLAAEVAVRCGGSVRRTSHTDSEPSLVLGMGHFWHLTPAFTVHDAAGELLATIVDDITITADLTREPARAGTSWYRILCDDPRLLRLIDDHSDPAAPFDEALDRVARVFGTSVEVVGGARRLRDAAGDTIALAAPLPPGRERPCEIVTPPLVRDHEQALEALLGPARDLGFTVPTEAAVHLHVDAGPFRSVAASTNLVRLFGHWRAHLRAVLGTNPSCTRLQALPGSLVALADRTPETWAGWQQEAAATGITKYYDVNLTALLTDIPHRDTVEVRILPGALHASDVTARTALVEALLTRCRDTAPVPRPTTDPSMDPDGAAAELRALAAGASGGTALRLQDLAPAGAPR